MEWQYTPYAFPLVVAAAIAAAIAAYAWRRRPAPGTLPLAVLMAAVTEWSLAYALELASASLAGEQFWDNVSYLGVAIVPAAWLAFALEYSGRGHWLTPRVAALLAVEPLLLLVCVWTNGAHGLVHAALLQERVDGFRLMASVHGAGFWVNVVYSYALSLVGTILISPFPRGLAQPHTLYRGQSVMLLVAVAMPWAGNVIYNLGLSPFRELDLTPFAFVISGAALAWNVVRFRLLDIVPVARDAVIESMSDAVVVLDEWHRILDLNPAAQRVLALTSRAAIGKPLAYLLPEAADLLRLCEHAGEARGEVTLGTGGDARCYDVRISRLRTRSGLAAGGTGHLVMLDDITEHRRAEDALRHSEERFRKVFEGAPIGMLILDAGDHIVQVNRAICDMLLYDEQELTALTLAHLMYPEDAAACGRLAAQVLHGAIASFQLEQRLRKHNQEILWAELTMAAIRNGGDAPYRLAMVENVFARKRAELLEDEQRHIAYELHDGLAQVVAGTHLQLQAFAGHYRPRSPQARAALDRALELARRATQEARHVIAGLRPTMVEELGVATALRMYVEGLRAEGWTITYWEALGTVRLPAPLETALYRVALEALTNVRKHAQPTRVQVRLTREDDRVCLEVRDWGCGFDPGAPRTAPETFGHIGLREMEDRVALLGGQFSVESRPGEGTRIVVTAPAPAVGGAAAPLALAASESVVGRGHADE